MNRATFIGNLTRDPETRTIQKLNNESSVTNFTVAASYGYGEYKHTDFIRVSAWNGLGKSCGQYLRKGSKVFIAGPVTVNSFINTDGNAVGNLELRLEEVEFLSGKSSEQAERPENPTVQDSDEEDVDELL